MEKDLILNLLKMLISDDKNEITNKHALEGKPVIVRATGAGVHFGYLVSQEGQKVCLKNSRRMWRWWAAKGMTLSGVAEFGLNLDKKKELRIQNELPYIEILDACEVISVSNECVLSFDRVEPYNEQ